jgi:hypothetical protein
LFIAFPPHTQNEERRCIVLFVDNEFIFGEFTVEHLIDERLKLAILQIVEYEVISQACNNELNVVVVLFLLDFLEVLLDSAYFI